MSTKDKLGFTLVELMVVAVIVAVLAAAAIPLMTGNRKRAAATEAEAGAGTVRTSLRTLYMETRDYSRGLDGNPISSIWQIPVMTPSDLDGHFFDHFAYSVAVGTNTFTITARGTDSLAPDADKVRGVVVTLDQDGKFTRTGI